MAALVGVTVGTFLFDGLHNADAGIIPMAPPAGFIPKDPPAPGDLVLRLTILDPFGLPGGKLKANSELEFLLHPGTPAARPIIVPLTKGMTELQVAQEIQKALAPFNGVPDTMVFPTPKGPSVYLRSPRPLELHLNGNTTGEEFHFNGKAAPPPPFPKPIKLAFRIFSNSSFSGQDVDGGMSRFAGGFVFDANTISFDLAFDELISNSSSALATQAFNILQSQLDPSLRDRLVLNSADGEIGFLSPDYTDTAGVYFRTTDSQGISGGGIEVVPEPSVWGLAMVGLFAGAGFVMRRRKLTPGEEWSRAKLSWW